MATVVAEPQNMVALRRANEIRLGRAQLKREIRRGTASIEGVLLEPPEVAETMTLMELLTCQRRWGTTRTSTFLGRLMVPEAKTVGSLTARQARLIVAQLNRSEASDRDMLLERMAALLASAGPAGALCSELAGEMGYRSCEVAGFLRSLEGRGRARGVPTGQHSTKRWYAVP